MSNRNAALKWWKRFKIHSKWHFIEIWKESLPETDRKKEWTFSMVDKSTATITDIYEYIINKND
jgi:hypothetical protein